jgi:type I restriction-modification system DNA methylase subunit
MEIKYRTVSYQEIKENNYSLNPKDYINDEEEE